MDLFIRFFFVAVVFALLGTFLGYAPILSIGFATVIVIIFAIVGLCVKEVTAFLFLPWTMLWKFLIHRKTYTSEQALHMAQKLMTLVILPLPLLIGIDFVWFDFAGAKWLLAHWLPIVIGQVAVTTLTYPITKDYIETRKVNSYFDGVVDWEPIS